MDELVEKGKKRLEWAREHMEVIGKVKDEISERGHLEGKNISMALHVEAKTGILALSLHEAGANVKMASCNPLSTDDSVAEALREEHGLDVYAKRGQDEEEYYENLNATLEHDPDVVIDDGGDLISLIHTEREDLIPGIAGGAEETTTGIVRLRAMEEDDALRFPVMSVNDAYMKHLFDNRYGTGQSTMDGILKATNLQLSGKNFLVGGYGWCGRGIAMRAKGMGADVMISEVDPIKAVEARMDGFRVLPAEEGIQKADFVVTATGCKDVIGEDEIKKAKDGCILSNSGHFDNEISKRSLEELSESSREVREDVTEYRMKDGRKLYLLAEGRLVNLAAGQGHPAEIMDMSFALQMMAAEYVVKNDDLKPKVYDIPRKIDEKIALLKLESDDIEIDRLTEEQKNYLEGWQEGT
ncbi:MAG: adenosylhomocysteinase [Candidatus Thermoplasmatota archaeon]|nr:adenosylhomocysteinase [Candidatus Thermoplasmatota archaeon]